MLFSFVKPDRTLRRECNLFCEINLFNAVTVVVFKRVTVQEHNSGGLLKVILMNHKRLRYGAIKFAP